MSHTEGSSWLLASLAGATPPLPNPPGVGAAHLGRMGQTPIRYNPGALHPTSKGWMGACPIYLEWAAPTPGGND